MTKLVLFFLFAGHWCMAQTVITGKWQTIDDETGDARSIVEIYARDGKLFGRVSRLLPRAGEDPDPVCTACDKDDPRYGKKIIGMEIIQDMVVDGDQYGSGTILDPESGKVYRCRLWIEDNMLKVRGYWGVFYRTQTWSKAN